MLRSAAPDTDAAVGAEALFSSAHRVLGRGWAVAAVVAVSILLLSVGGSVLLSIRSGEAIESTSRMRLVRVAVSRLLEAVLNAESGQRGFLLTGDPTYVAPYEAALRAMPTVFTQLRDAVADNPSTVSAIAPIRRLADAKLAELATTLALYRSGDVAGSIALVKTGTGNADMEAMRELTSRILASNFTLVESETGRIARGRLWLVVFDLVGFVLILLLVGAAWVAVRRAVTTLHEAGARLAAANAELATVNDTLDERVSQRTSALTEANEEIQRFAYIVSHDLRAPLVNIMGFTSELDTVGRSVARLVEAAAPHVPAPVLAEARLAISEDLPEAIRFIKTSAARMDRLIGAILQLSREGRRVIKAERVAMKQLVGGVVETLATQLAAGVAEVTVGELPDVVSDRLALEQVFANLLENAVKYLKPGRPGRIAVRGRSVGGEVIIDVEDNGRGIAPRDHQRVFELFRRAGDQTVPGEGIGLAHVRALVRRLGGRIDCLSALDVGSTFRVQLPLVLVQGGANQ